ncbi:hypothetical protein [Nonomuraea sp. NPDC049400]|uniref:hypothetical protein n=1 Tax=Nonomuraea sp. NPDC049400 TaxID=3364352 RepID=UPI0037B9F0DC
MTSAGKDTGLAYLGHALEGRAVVLPRLLETLGARPCPRRADLGGLAVERGHGGADRSRSKVSA